MVVTATGGGAAESGHGIEFRTLGLFQVEMRDAPTLQQLLFRNALFCRPPPSCRVVGNCARDLSHRVPGRLPDGLVLGGRSLAQAWERLLKRAHPRRPRQLQTDQGKEFYNRPFQQVLKKHTIHPWVNKNARSPMGHLELIYAPNTVDLHPYFCLVKCTVLPPPGLYHPVLPHRTGEKLTFPLCRTCVENQLDRPLHDKTTGADGHLVHPRTEQSRGARLRGAENLRSVAFCPKLTRAFHRVCKYLAENQRRGQRVASRLYDPGKPGPTPPRLRATGRHPTGL